MRIEELILLFRKLPKAKREKRAFYRSLPENSRVLDVGCGSDSVKVAKCYRPDIFYAGIDVIDCNNSKESISCADAYIEVESNLFPEGIISACGENLFDAVVSSINVFK